MRLDHSSRRRHAATLALGVAAALALAGCTGGGDDPPATGTTSVPTPSTAATTTTATTPPSTAASTGMPDAAKQNSKAGAEAFVRYFAKQQAVAWQRAEPAELDGLCLPSAKTCAAFRESARTLQQQNQHLDRPPIEIQQVAEAGVDNATHLVRLDGKQTPARILNADGTVASTTPTKQVALIFELQWIDKWQVSAIKVAS